MKAPITAENNIKTKKIPEKNINEIYKNHATGVCNLFEKEYIQNILPGERARFFGQTKCPPSKELIKEFEDHAKALYSQINTNFNVLDEDNIINAVSFCKDWILEVTENLESYLRNSCDFLIANGASDEDKENCIRDLCNAYVFTITGKIINELTTNQQVTDDEKSKMLMMMFLIQNMSTATTNKAFTKYFTDQSANQIYTDIAVRSFNNTSQTNENKVKLQEIYKNTNHPFIIELGQFYPRLLQFKDNIGEDSKKKEQYKIALSQYEKIKNIIIKKGGMENFTAEEVKTLYKGLAEIKNLILANKFNQLNKTIDTQEQLQATLKEVREIESEIAQMGGNNDSLWIRLGKEIDDIMNHIIDQTSAACQDEIDSEKRRLTERFKLDWGYADSYSGEVVVEFPDPNDEKYKLSDDRKNEIENRYQNTTVANQIVVSNEFIKLETLRNRIKSKAIESSFNTACRNLEEAANRSKSKEIKEAGIYLLNTIKNVKNKGDIKDNDLPRIKRYLNEAADLINHPSEDKYYNQHLKNINDAIGKNRPWGPTVGGALLCIAGILLVAAAVTVTVLTFGISSPLTLPTAVAGGALTAAGIAMVTGAAVGLAATAITGTVVAIKAGKFAYNGPIANAMEEVSSSIEKMKTIKTTLNNIKEDSEDDLEYDSEDDPKDDLEVDQEVDQEDDSEKEKEKENSILFQT